MDQNQIEPIINNNPAQLIQDTPKPKNKRPKSLIFVIILGILLAGAAGFMIWQNYFSTEKTVQNNTSQTSTNNKIVATTAIDTHTITSSIIEKLLGKYTLVSGQQSITKITDVSIDESNNAPLWKITGTERYVDYTDQNAASLAINIQTVNVDYSANYREIGGYIQSSFESNGLSKIGTTTNMLGQRSIYSKDDVICSTDYDPSGASSLLSVACGQKSKYTTNLASYISAKPFFDAADIKSGSISTTNLIIKSGMDGYVNTYLSFSNAAHLFYKAANGQWQYFKATQQALPCSDFNTSALKSAFAYELCYNGQTNKLSTVFNYYGL